MMKRNDQGKFLLNSTDANRLGAAEWNSIQTVGPDEAVGLMLQTIGDHTFAHQALVQTVFFPPDPCNEFAHRSTVELIYTDASMVMTYQPLVAARSLRDRDHDVPGLVTHRLASEVTISGPGQFHSKGDSS